VLEQDKEDVRKLKRRAKTVHSLKKMDAQVLAPTWQVLRRERGLDESKMRTQNKEQKEKLGQARLGDKEAGTRENEARTVVREAIVCYMYLG
jgi:hypothetical protein